MTPKTSRTHRRVSEFVLSAIVASFAALIIAPLGSFAADDIVSDAKKKKKKRISRKLEPRSPNSKLSMIRARNFVFLYS